MVLLLAKVGSKVYDWSPKELMGNILTIHLMQLLETTSHPSLRLTLQSHLIFGLNAIPDSVVVMLH